jgi:hypothetical protein
VKIWYIASDADPVPSISYNSILEIDKYFIIYSKNFVLKHIILYVHCVDLLIGSQTKLDFLFYNFSVIYYDFLKIQPK